MNNNIKDLTIVTSLYKSEAFIEKYIKRAENFQLKLLKKGVTVEFVIIANDISDLENRLLLSCKIKNMKLIRVKLETLYASWNRGVREAESQAICFWNVDDIRFPKAIPLGLKELKKVANIVYFDFFISGWYKINKFRSFIKRPLLYMFKKVSPIEYNRKRFVSEMHCGPFFMFSKNAIITNGYFDEQFLIAGDFEWCARAAYNSLSFKKISCISGIFQYHGNNLSGSHKNQHIIENGLVILRYSQS